MRFLGLDYAKHNKQYSRGVGTPTIIMIRSYRDEHHRCTTWCATAVVLLGVVGVMSRVSLAVQRQDKQALAW